DTGLQDANADDLADNISTPRGGFANAGEPIYQVAFCAPASPNVGSCPETPAPPTCNPTSPLALEALVASCGWSDDRAARRLVTRLIRNTPSMPGPATNPVTAKGGVNVSGNVSVANYFNNLSIWTGETLDTASATGKTFIRKPTLDVPENPDFSDPDSWADYTPPDGEISENFNFANCTSANFICGTQKNVQGPDVIDNDTTLAGITDDDLFRNFFGYDPATYLDRSVSNEVTSATLDDGTNRAREIIWVNGDLNGLPDELGTRTEPVVLIVDGNFNTSGNPILNGVLYVRGDIQGSGTPVINGALIAEGTVNKSGGNIEVLYDPLAVGIASRLGDAASVPGTWRDW
ncbi:MAG: hypothetical protein RI637_07355, partial [Acidimicrobiia bacterium]|nr:hypothetical protein [Acidimicrobiia bacterium]